MSLFEDQMETTELYQIAKRYLLYLQLERRLEVNTINSRWYDIEKYIQFLIKNKINDYNKVNASHINSFISELKFYRKYNRKEKYSNNTINRYISSIKNFHFYLLDNNFVEESLPEWKGAWTTSTSYGLGDLVRNDGSSYICTEAHTSGTFSTDLSASKWELFAQKGAAGAGAGDMISTNNLSDLDGDWHRNTGLLSKSPIETLVSAAAAHSKAVLMAVALLTAVSVFFALKLEPIFDVKDFFDSGSEMVVGLDKLDEHVGDTGGEPGVVYVRGDLVEPSAIIAISDFIESLRDIDYIAETPSGSVTAGLNVVNVSRFITASPLTISAIKSETGISVSDIDRDGIPDSREQIEAALRFASERGVIGAGGNQFLTPEQVRQAIYLSDEGEHITVIWFQIPGTRDQEIVTATERSIQPKLAELRDHGSISKVGLTGSPFTRKAQLSASTRTLYTSLPIALVAAIILLTATMRSIRYAAVTVIPIVLVVAWLYGIMYVSGFALNFVTAMIGAISIGIGIDYSIHMTERFREELRRTNNSMDAIKLTANGTGVALVASAASSIVGFAILGFAPMPMFAAYGQLTAVMIFLALIASLIVLPCLLMVVTNTSDTIGRP